MDHRNYRKSRKATAKILLNFEPGFDVGADYAEHWDNFQDTDSTEHRHVHHQAYETENPFPNRWAFEPHLNERSFHDSYHSRRLTQNPEHISMASRPLRHLDFSLHDIPPREILSFDNTHDFVPYKKQPVTQNRDQERHLRFIPYVCESEISPEHVTYDKSKRYHSVPHPNRRIKPLCTPDQSRVVGSSAPGLEGREQNITDWFQQFSINSPQQPQRIFRTYEPLDVPFTRHGQHPKPEFAGLQNYVSHSTQTYPPEHSWRRTERPGPRDSAYPGPQQNCEVTDFEQDAAGDDWVPEDDDYYDYDPEAYIRGDGDEQASSEDKDTCRENKAPGPQTAPSPTANDDDKIPTQAPFTSHPGPRLRSAPLDKLASTILKRSLPLLHGPAPPPEAVRAAQDRATETLHKAQADEREFDPDLIFYMQTWYSRGVELAKDKTAPRLPIAIFENVVAILETYEKAYLLDAREYRDTVVSTETLEYIHMCMLALQGQFLVEKMGVLAG